MVDKERMFEDFTARVNEIARHKDEIERLDFTASLMNGTRFSFSYDRQRFEREANRKSMPEAKRELVSPMNAVIDICCAIAVIVMLVLTAVTGRLDALDASMLSLFMVFYALSATMHLFPTSMNRTVRVLRLVRFALLSLSTCTLVLTQCTSMQFALPITFLVALIAFAVESIGTRGAMKAGQIVLALTSLAALPFCQIASGTVLTLSLSALASLIPAFVPQSRQSLRTCGLFHLVALLSWMLQAFQMA